MYTWKPNRDSGSVRSHRNPNTRRRYPRSEVGMMFKANNGRARMNNAMHAAFPELSTGQFDILFRRVRSGWDAGDPLSTSAIVVESTAVEEVEPYPEIPEWMWDCLYAASIGVKHAENCVYCDWRS